MRMSQRFTVPLWICTIHRLINYLTASSFSLSLSLFELILDNKPTNTAALTCLEKYETQELQEALEIVPELVARESAPLDFLRTEMYNPVKAAIRLAKYWKARKICFAERWLLPLNQTGAGALSMEDVEMLRTGSRVFIQRPGQGVLVIADDSRLPRSLGVFMFRLMFYIARLYDDEINQREGATFMFIGECINTRTYSTICFVDI